MRSGDYLVKSNIVLRRVFVCDDDDQMKQQTTTAL